MPELIPTAQAIPIRYSPERPELLQALLGVRKSRSYNGLLCVPGGKIDPGETALLAAIRELRDETGGIITPEKICEIGQGFSVDPCTNQAYLIKIHVANATGLELWNASPDEHSSMDWHNIMPLVEQHRLSGRDLLPRGLAQGLTHIAQFSGKPIPEIQSVLTARHVLSQTIGRAA